MTDRFQCLIFAVLTKVLNDEAVFRQAARIIKVVLCRCSTGTSSLAPFSESDICERLASRKTAGPYPRLIIVAARGGTGLQGGPLTNISEDLARISANF